jgi:hypothetical protein
MPECNCEQKWVQNLPEEKKTYACHGLHIEPPHGISFILYFTGTILAVKSQSLADS